MINLILGQHFPVRPLVTGLATRPLATLRSWPRWCPWPVARGRLGGVARVQIDFLFEHAQAVHQLVLALQQLADHVVTCRYRLGQIGLPVFWQWGGAAAHVDQSNRRSVRGRKCCAGGEQILVNVQ